MKRLIGCVAAGLVAVSTALSADVDAGGWPNWRGPNDDGVVTDGNPPVEWSESKNVRWKVTIPGTGHATPIAWGDRIYVQTAEPVEQGSAKLRFIVLAIDRHSGKTVWRKTLRTTVPAETRHHRTASFASTSGVTDGEHLYAYFGSQGLYCLDFDGNVKWEKDLGDMRTRNSFGEGSAPSIHGSTLVVNWDHEGDSFIVALDKRTGKERWRKDRNEVTTWVTPLIVEHGGAAQVIIPASRRTRSYDLETGKVVWELAGLGTNVIPMPFHEDGVVYVSSGHRSPAMQAVRLDGAKGDITGTDAVLWSITQNTPYVSTPVLHDGRIYQMKNRNAILTCYDAADGRLVYGPERLEGMGHVYASLLSVKDRIYISDLDGRTLVIRAGDKFDPIATNELDDGFAASPVVIGDTLYMRGYRHLYAIAAEK